MNKNKISDKKNKKRIKRKNILKKNNEKKVAAKKPVKKTTAKKKAGKKSAASAHRKTAAKRKLAKLEKLISEFPEKCSSCKKTFSPTDETIDSWKIVSTSSTFDIFCDACSDEI